MPLVAIALLLAWLASFVCWLIIEIKLFKTGNTVGGLLGLFCGAVAFILGWTQSDDLDSVLVMQVWTLAVIAKVALWFQFHGSAGAAQ